MKTLDLDAAQKPVSNVPHGKKPLRNAPHEKITSERLPSLTPLLMGGLALVFVASAVAWIIVRSLPEEIRFNLNEMEAVVGEAFPTSARYLRLLDATASNPRVGLAEGNDRIGMRFDLSLAPTEHEARWGGGDQSGRLELSTQIDVTAGIRYAPETGEVYLQDLAIERMDVGGTPPEFQNDAPRFVAGLIESAVKTRPVYTLRATDTKMSPARLRLKSLSVEDGEVVIALGISSKATPR